MTLPKEIEQLRQSHFCALILDNEVTVGEFVTTPPLPWRRLVELNGSFTIAPGYPTLLTAEQAAFEMKNWDRVSLEAIAVMLANLHESVDYVVIGNNAGQGFPLAQSLTKHLVSDRAAVIYAASLPEISAYRNIGFGNFYRRRETVTRLAALAANSGRPLSLCFINTIQHNESNYHNP
jgi:hypothetical protein